MSFYGRSVDRSDLVAFTKEVAERFEHKEIRGPIHLNSESQIEPLIEIFKEIKRTDYVLSTWRSTYHALLHGVPRDKVMAEILAGRSMQLHFPEHRFMSSSIVGGMLPIACGLASRERVWCFVGDMCESTGGFKDAQRYASGHGLDLHLVVENNGLSTNTPTSLTWGLESAKQYRGYDYKRTTQHCGTDTYVAF